MGVGYPADVRNIIMSKNNNDCKTAFVRFPSDVISIASVYIQHYNIILIAGY